MSPRPRTRTLLTALLGLVFGSLVLFAAVSPAFAQTQGPTTANGFVQCSSTLGQTTSAGTTTASLPSCDLCSLFKLVNNATFYAVSFLLAVATTMMLVSGFLYVTAAGDEHRITQAKTSIKFAVVGFIIAMLAGIVVKTIVTNVFKGSSPGLGTFTCQITDAPSAPGAPGGGTQPPTTPTTPPTSGTLTDAQARQKLQGSDIGIKSGASLNGIQSSTLDGLLALRAQCPTCVITITSGTDGVHDNGTYSHANGYKVDLRTSDTLTNFIRTNFTPAGTRKGDGAPLYTDVNGNYYAYETCGTGLHWDVVYCYGKCTGGA